MRPVCNRAMIDFYDDNELIPISKDDPDLEILGQGLLRLPPSVPKPQRAPVHCADVLTVFRFVDAFRAELKLPKGTVNDLQVRIVCIPLLWRSSVALYIKRKLWPCTRIFKDQHPLTFFDPWIENFKKRLLMNESYKNHMAKTLKHL
jgi:hypothetical protein